MVYVRRLVWNPGNVAHIARHRVTLEEAEEVCHGNPVALQSRLGRIILIGLTRAGRMPAVIIEPVDGDVYLPLTARPASRKERRYYQQRLGGTQQ